MHEEVVQKEMPPETGGISQQPTQDELRVIAESFTEEEKPSQKPLIFIVLGAVVLLLVGGFLFLQASQSPQSVQEITEVVEQVEDTQPVPEPSPTELTFLDYVFSGSFTEEFAGSMEMTPFDTNWQDRGLAFMMVASYDLGVVPATHYVLPAEYIGMRVVIVQLDVEDTRLTGQPIDVNADTYVATRYKQTDTTAAHWKETTSLPGQQQTVYVPFILDAEVTDYFILSGDLRNPFVSPVGDPELPTPSPTPEN